MPQISRRINDEPEQQVNLGKDREGKFRNFFEVPINIHKNYIKYVVTRYFPIHEVRPRPVLSSPPQALEHTGRHTPLSMHFQPHVSLPPKTIWVTYVTRVTIVT